MSGQGIFVYACTYNDVELMRWWLRHYSQLAARMIITDDDSTDGTQDVVNSYHGARVERWQWRNGLDEDQRLHWAYKCQIDAQRSGADWCILVDSDEFIAAPDMNPQSIITILEAEQAAGTEVVKTCGWNMVGDGLPKDDGRSQIYDLLQTGVRSSVYSKPVVLRPHTRANWVRGFHNLENCNPKLSDGPKLKLLHYRYLGLEYTRERNGRNYTRLDLKGGDKGCGWSVSPLYTGADKEGSPEWAEAIKSKAINAIEAPL